MDPSPPALPSSAVGLLESAGRTTHCSQVDCQSHWRKSLQAKGKRHESSFSMGKPPCDGKSGGPLIPPVRTWVDWVSFQKVQAITEIGEKRGLEKGKVLGPDLGGNHRRGCLQAHSRCPIFSGIGPWTIRGAVADEAA
jgi:hypothetical protein